MDFRFPYTGVNYAAQLYLKMFIQRIEFVNLGYFYTLLSAATRNLYLDLVPNCDIGVHASELKQDSFVIVEYQS